jgi:hypothetical protein
MPKKILQFTKRLLASVAASFLVSLLGTFSHRSGSNSFPYGIFLAAILAFSVGWIIRYNFDYIYVFVYALFSAVIVYKLSVMTGSGSLLIIGGLENTPFVFQILGYIWVYGVFIFCALPLVFPKKLFAKPAPSENNYYNEHYDESDYLDGERGA